MNVDDVPAVLTGLLGHRSPGCQGTWDIKRFSHPTSLTTVRLVLFCSACGEGHVFDVTAIHPAHHVERALAGNPSMQAELDAAVETVRPLLSLVKP